ncbi:Preprotein translocase subunit SecB [Bacteroidales bacterium Barb6]|nr:Preprotein translocase subunit SecB [Bacteroidales bacterium Barb6]
METKEQPQLAFQGVDILSVKFNILGTFTNVEKNVKIDCTPKVFYPKEHPEQFNIIADLELNCDGCFELSVKAVGVFNLSQDITEELKRRFVNANAFAIMFPYIRAFITTLSSNMGNSIGRIVIPPQFFNGELEEIDNLEGQESQ